MHNTLWLLQLHYTASNQMTERTEGRRKGQNKIDVDRKLDTTQRKTTLTSHNFMIPKLNNFTNSQPCKGENIR